MTPRRFRDEGGAATLLVVTCLALLLMVGASTAVVAAVFRAHRSAQSAADLAALAGATARQRDGDACSVASRIAVANLAELVECRLEGEDVVVRVVLSGPRWLGQDTDLVGEARAGPAP